MGQPVPGTAKGTRTPDLLIRSQSLYPTELPPHTSASAVPKYNNIPLQKMQALFSNNPNIFHIQQAGPHLTENGACSRITPDKAIRVIQQTAKLLFARSLELSLRDQSADWSWQSPNNSGRFVRAFVRFSVISEDLGDCHVASLLAMTAFVWCAKQQFVALLFKADCLNAGY